MRTQDCKEMMHWWCLLRIGRSRLCLAYELRFLTDFRVPPMSHRSKYLLLGCGSDWVWTNLGCFEDCSAEKIHSVQLVIAFKVQHRRERESVDTQLSSDTDIDSCGNEWRVIRLDRISDWL